MDREGVRLEILKLVNRHDYRPEDLILRAKSFEEYIFSDAKPSQSKSTNETEMKSKSSKSNKKSDTADVLS